MTTEQNATPLGTNAESDGASELSRYKELVQKYLDGSISPEEGDELWRLEHIRDQSETRSGGAESTDAPTYERYRELERKFLKGSINEQEEYTTFLAQHTEGGFAFYNAYTSTSTEPSGHPMADGTTLGVTLEIISKNARSLDGFGSNFESEALFPRDTDFIITKVTVDKDGYPYIYMREV